MGSKVESWRYSRRPRHPRCPYGSWAIGLDPLAYGTALPRRTKSVHDLRRTGNLRAVQLLLEHTKSESTVRHLGIEVEDAFAIAEQVEL
jgi:hypothetical protein